MLFNRPDTNKFIVSQLAMSLLEPNESRGGGESGKTPIKHFD